MLTILLYLYVNQFLFIAYIYIMAERKGAPRRRARMGQDRYQYKIFPTPIAAALFFAEHRDYPLDHLQYSTDERSGYFPESTATFGSDTEIWELLDRTSGERHAAEQARKASGPSKKMTGHEEYVPSWTTPEFMEWIATRQLGRAILAQHKRYIDQGWHLDPAGTWYHDEDEGPQERRANWETAPNNTWKTGMAEFTETPANNQGIVEDIEEASLRYLRMDMVSKTGGNSSVHAEASLEPTRALYLIKILLMQHGTRAARNHANIIYPQTEIERLIARRQAIYASMREAESEYRKSGKTVQKYQTEYEYLRMQHANCNSLIEQLKLTSIVPYKLAQIDALIQDLAADIEEAHTRIDETQNERGRLLNNKERLALCLEERPGRRSSDIRHSAAKILQIAEMIIAHDSGDLHSTAEGRRVIIEEVENAIAILKLYSILDVYGGNDATADLCSVVNMRPYDGYLARLARANPQYRVSLYQGRLMTHSWTGIPIEALKRASLAFRIGVKSAVQGAQLIAKSVAREGVRTTLSCSAGAVFSRLGSALFGALRELADDVLTPELAAIEASVEDWRVPPTIPQIKQVAEAITQTDVPPALKKELVQIRKDLFTILAEAGHADLDALIHDPALRVFEVLPAGHNHFMYYVKSTDQWVEMDNSQESFEELEERLTRDTIYASLEPDHWEEIIDPERGNYWYNHTTGLYAHEHPVGTRELIELDIEIGDAAETIDREEIQAADAAEGGGRVRSIPGGAAALQEAGSPTGILDQQDFSGRVNELKKLNKEVKEARYYLHYGFNKDHPHAEQFAQVLNEQANNEIANQWTRAHLRQREEINVAHRPHTNREPRSNFDRAVLARRKGRKEKYQENPHLSQWAQVQREREQEHAAKWAQVQDEMANEQEEQLAEWEQGPVVSNMTNVSRRSPQRRGSNVSRRGPPGRKPQRASAQREESNESGSNESGSPDVPEWIRAKWAENNARKSQQSGSQGGRASQGRASKGKASKGARKSRGRQPGAQNATQWAQQLYPERFAQGEQINDQEYALAQRNQEQARRGTRKSRGRQQAAQAEQWAALPLSARLNNALQSNRLPSSNNESM